MFLERPYPLLFFEFFSSQAVSTPLVLESNQLLRLGPFAPMGSMPPRNELSVFRFIPLVDKVPWRVFRGPTAGHLQSKLLELASDGLDVVQLELLVWEELAEGG